MSKIKTPWLIIATVMAAALILVFTWVTTNSKPQVDALVQSNSGGSVTIEATLLGHEGDSLVFDISMDTHSVDLNAYDLKQLAVLLDDKGIEYRPIEWTAAEGGHHRSGKLVFDHTDTSSKTFELVISNVAGVGERVLKWRE